MNDSTTKDALHSTKEELNVEYANNALFEPTIWDLKIIFGEWSARSNAVDWHTSMTLPWAQAKLMAYYLAINVAAHELKNGTIKVPDAMIPNDPATLSEPTGEDAAVQKAFVQIATEYRKKFLESLK